MGIEDGAVIAQGWSIGPESDGQVAIKFHTNGPSINMVIGPNEAMRFCEYLIFNVLRSPNPQHQDAQSLGKFPIAVTGLHLSASDTPDHVVLALRSGQLSLMFDIPRDDLVSGLGG